MPKGLIFDIRRYSVHDGPGIRTTVFFKGCPMQCVWCHNPESWLDAPQVMVRKRRFNGTERQIKEVVGRWMTPGEVMEVVSRDRVFYDESGGGVTFSGGEPLLQAAFLLNLLKHCRQAGIHTAVDTSGYADRDIFLEVAHNTPLLLYDLKVIDDHHHLTFTGTDNRKIIQNLLSLPADGPRLIIRIPVIPGVNNSIKQMKAIRDVLKQVRAPIMRVDLLPYHRLGKHKYEALNMSVPKDFTKRMSHAQPLDFKKIFTNACYSVKTGG